MHSKLLSSDKWFERTLASPERCKRFMIQKTPYPCLDKALTRNLGLLMDDGRYNLLAQLLSDNSHLPLRVAIFSGKTKADRMYSVREFGFQCILYSLDEVLRYGDVLNIIQADETDRVVERKEVPLFENDVHQGTLEKECFIRMS